jgi:hypothetical protein
MHQQRASIPLPSLVDPSQHDALPTRLLFGHEPKPGRDVATIVKGVGIADRGIESGRGERPHPFDVAQALTRLNLLTSSHQACGVRSPLRIECTHPVIHILEHLSA